MKKVLMVMLTFFCLTTMMFAVVADPDPDMPERWAREAQITPKALRPVVSATPLPAGDYYIPKGSNALGFDSLHIAVDSINANGVTGTVNLILDADTLNEPSFTFNAALSADNHVVVKPATGRNVCLIVSGGASMGNGVQMIGFTTGHVTFDGSNDGTDSQNLTVTTKQVSPVVDVPFGLNGGLADTVVLKNLIIKNIGITGQTNFRYGAVINDKDGVVGFRVENCVIGTSEKPVRRDGIAPWGRTASGNQFSVVNNQIYCGTRGVATYLLYDSEIIGNTITLLPTTAVNTNDYMHGIYITGAVGSTVIRDNTVLCLEKTNRTAGYLIGIAFAGNAYSTGDVIEIVNNFVNVGAADETRPIYGIGFRSAGNMGNLKVYHNTILVNTNSSALASHGIGNHTNGTGPVNVDLQNNIIINNHASNTGSSAIGLIPTTSVLTSDNNVLKSNQNFVNYMGTSYADLATWQATGQDANSVSKDVTFTSASDLHLAVPSDTDLDIIMPKIGTVMTDIDGDPRNNLAWAYAGADEGTAYPVSNDLNLTFDTNADVTNWSHYDETNVYTVEAWSADSTLRLSDAGYDFIAKRPVVATPGWLYKLSIDIKTNLWTGANNVLELSVQGLGNDDVKYSCISDSVWTTYTFIGIAGSDSGYIRIGGSKSGTVDTVWVDNVVWNDMYLNIIPSANIADARGGAIGDTVATVGVATTTKNFGSAGPVYIQDGTAGLAVYNYAAAQNVELGDEIMAIGKLKNYNGLLELDPVIDYMVLSKENEVLPVEITAADMDGEAYEGMLVVLTGCDSTEAGVVWPASGSNKGFNLKDKNDSTFYCYIDKDTDIDGSPKPDIWPLDITGIVGDYNGAQILPRSLADIVTSDIAPGAFTILNPADETVVTSLDDPNIVKALVGTDSVLTLFVKWSKALDPDEGDVVTYELFITPDGPDEALITQDTVLYIPINVDRPWDMNGVYEAYVTATDLAGATTISDTITMTFDFPAPPEVTHSDIVLVDGTPKYYAEFNMPIAPEVANFKFIDYSNGGSVSEATAIEYNGAQDILISGDIAEDHWVALAYSDVESLADSLSADPLTIADTTEAAEALIPFSANHPEDEAKPIETFESNTGTFWAPTGSGSTWGVLTTSTFAVSDEAAYHGTKSAKLTLLDDPTKAGGYVRLYHQLKKSIKTTSKVMFLVKGTNADVEMRISVKDTGYEQGPWTKVSIKEDDWQVVSFDLQNDSAQGWVNGNSIVDGASVLFEAIHMRWSGDADMVFYIDDIIERPNSNLAPSPFTMVKPTEGYEITNNDLVQDTLIEVAWTKAVDPEGDVVKYQLFVVDAAVDTVEFTVDLPDTANLLEAPSYEDNGSYKMYVLAFDSWGAFSSSDTISFTINMPLVGIESEALPKVFALHQNYPNPFNPTTMIKYDLPKESNVKLVIYDLMGREVRTLVSAKQSAGYKAIQWDSKNNAGRFVSSGYYICVMNAGEFHKNIKMILMK